MNTTKSYMMVDLWCCIFELMEFKTKDLVAIEFSICAKKRKKKTKD